MAYTRRKTKGKTKGKSLCLTDFFNPGESTSIAPPDYLHLDMQSSPSSPNRHSGADDVAEDQRRNTQAAAVPKQHTQPPPGPQGLKRTASTQDSNKTSDSGPSSADLEPHIPLGSSSTSSPVKHRAKLDAPEQEEFNTPLSREDMLSDFPVADLTLSPALLKDMMLALRSSIQASLTSALSSHRTDIDNLGERVDHVETKLAEFSEAHNGLVDTHNSLEDDFQALSAKVADIEDRNRRNYIKIRGIPESVPNSELPRYIQQAMATLLQSTSDRDLIIDRAHRLPKPKNVPASAPRDVIVRIHFFHIKEALTRLARDTPHLPEPYHQLKLFADLSQYTIQARRALQPITTALRLQNTPYRWGFPTKLLITKNGVTHVITSVADGVPILKSLDIPFTPPSPSARRASRLMANGHRVALLPPEPPSTCTGTLLSCPGTGTLRYIVAFSIVGKLVATPRVYAVIVLHSFSY